MSGDNKISKLEQLQSQVAELRTQMVGDLLQLYSVRQNEADIQAIDVVVGYLHQASEDICILAYSMCNRFAKNEEIVRLSELSVRSFNKYKRAFDSWKAQCLH